MANFGQTMFRFAGALLLGAVAARFDHLPRATPTARVVVAATDIAEGRIIDRHAVSVATWPVSALPPGAFASVDSVIGRVARVPVFEGEAIVPGRLARALARRGLEVRLAPGMRAYSVRVSDESSVAGLVVPNSRVDVLALLADSASGGERKAWMVVQDVRVLAMGVVMRRAADGSGVRTRIATLEILPEHAEFLAPAAAEGELQLILRGEEHMGPVSGARIRAEALLPLR